MAADAPWDHGSLWSTMAFYMFSLHIPLSFGGLSVVAHVLHEPILDPQIEVSLFLDLYDRPGAKMPFYTIRFPEEWEMLEDTYTKSFTERGNLTSLFII